jgi:hypothetical protein
LDLITEDLAVFLKLKVAYSELTLGTSADVAYWVSARDEPVLVLCVGRDSGAVGPLLLTDAIADASGRRL